MTFITRQMFFKVMLQKIENEKVPLDRILMTDEVNVISMDLSVKKVSLLD